MRILHKLFLNFRKIFGMLTWISEDLDSPACGAPMPRAAGTSRQELVVQWKSRSSFTNFWTVVRVQKFIKMIVWIGLPCGMNLV